jgi:CBS domain-containing protein
LPVVAEDGRLVGIITDGDLLRRSDLQTRLDLQASLSAAQIQRQLAGLQRQTKQAVHLMTQPVVTVNAADPVRQAAARMAERGLKRLPVVDADQHLVGLVSRVDVLRALEYHQRGQESDQELPQSGAAVAELMYPDVPTVGADAQVEEIIRALEANQRRRVVVVDAERHVLGLITDGDLLRRSRQASHPGLLRRLRNLIAGQPEQTGVLPDAGETAAELMTTPVITIQTSTPLSEALNLMLKHQIKRLPVVDADGRLVGLLGRASLLHGFLGESPKDANTP